MRYPLIASIGVVPPGADVTVEWTAPAPTLVTGLLLEHMKGLRVRVELDEHLVIETADPRGGEWPLVPARTGAVLSIIFSNKGDAPVVGPGDVALRCRSGCRGLRGAIYEGLLGVHWIGLTPTLLSPGPGVFGSTLFRLGRFGPRGP